MGRFVAAIREAGVLLRGQSTGVAIGPPLTIERDQLDEIAGAIRAGLDAVSPRPADPPRSRRGTRARTPAGRRRGAACGRAPARARRSGGSGAPPRRSRRARVRDASSAPGGSRRRARARRRSRRSAGSPPCSSGVAERSTAENHRARRHRHVDQVDEPQRQAAVERAGDRKPLGVLVEAGLECDEHDRAALARHLRRQLRLGRARGAEESHPEPSRGSASRFQRGSVASALR